jgi:pimeloyl-ACP methyl ester carboxylesterase
VLPKTKYARSDDVSIAYQVSGEEPFDVVWAPGTMSHLDLDWEIPQRALFFERFSKFCRLIRFDKRGTGLSDRPVKMATLEERTDDIRAVMDAVGTERANIFGVSEGGSMACLFAATYPHRVNSLLVWGSQARWIATTDHPWGQTREQHSEMVAMIKDDWPSLDYITGPGAGVGKDADPAYLESIRRYMRAAANPAAVDAYEQMNGQIDIRPILPSIQAPTLVMNRTGDPCAHVEAARDMAARIPGAKFQEYPGDSHSMMLDDMDLRWTCPRGSLCARHYPRSPPARHRNSRRRAYRRMRIDGRQRRRHRRAHRSAYHGASRAGHCPRLQHSERSCLRLGYRFPGPRNAPAQRNSRRMEAFLRPRLSAKMEWRNRLASLSFPARGVQLC